jgi:hypothetical protein
MRRYERANTIASPPQCSGLTLVSVSSTLIHLLATAWACDLMEAARPKVDAYVLDWVMSQPLKREWFFEQRDGNCRLMASFAIRLCETAVMWRHAVAPFAE